jgi:hypothetical protein
MLRDQFAEAIGSVTVKIWVGILWALAILFRGFVISKIWLWFVVATLSVPELGTLAATGIYLTRFLFVKLEDAEAKSPHSSIKRIVFSSGISGLVLGLSFLIMLLMGTL